MSNLRPTMSLTTAVMYWIWTMIWAWIYVLVWKIASVSWFFTPRAFLVAAILAFFSAMSYAEMSSRFPQSAWASLYVYKWFNNIRLSRIIWVMILLSWIVSAWVLSHGFWSYLEVFVPRLPWSISALLIIIILWWVSLFWIKESANFIIVTTIISLLWLIFIIWVWSNSFSSMLENSDVLFTWLKTWSWIMSILAWSFLAFYAFIGFEDLANVAEELKDPVRDLPKTLIIVMILATILYGLVAIVAQFGMPLTELQWSEKPLAKLYTSITWKPAIIITIISLFSVLNSIMVQILMWSRLLYGMSNQWRIPKFLWYVSPKRKIPLFATLVTIVLMVIFAAMLPMITLAQFTSFLILTIFFLVNVSLIRVKIKNTNKDKNTNEFRVPIIIPILWAICNIWLLIVIIWNSFS